MPKKLELLRVLPLYLLAAVLPVSVSAGGVGVGLILLVALVLCVVDSQAKKQISLPVFRALLAFMLAYALSTVFSAPYSAHWHKWVEELWLKTLLVAVPLVVGTHYTHVVRVLKVSLFFAFLTGMYAIWQHFSGVDPVRDRSLMTEFGHNEVVGFFGHKLSYGGQLLIYLLLCLSLFITETGMKQKAFWGLGATLLMVALLWSHARSPLLGVIAGSVVLMFALRGWRRVIGFGFLPLSFLAVFSIPSLHDHFLRGLSLHRNATRLNLWESSWNAIKARPLLGFGPGNFGSMMETYEVDGFYNTRAHSHNDFLMHGVNGGLLGLVIALVLIAVVSILLWRLWKNGGQYAWVGLAGVAIQLGICTAGIFQVYQTDDEVEMLLYFVFGCALALGNSIKNNKLDQANGDSI